MRDMEADEIYRALSVPQTPKGITRRRLLQGAVLGAGTLAASPYFQAASWATTPLTGGEGILVAVQLAGGNDGLNTVVPTGDSNYYSKRSTLAVSQASALDLGSGFGLHPNLAKLKSRYDAGQVA